MVVLLHKCEFKYIEVEFLKGSEKIWSPGLPDIGARKPGTSWFWQLVQALHIYVGEYIQNICACLWVWFDYQVLN